MNILFKLFGVDKPFDNFARNLEEIGIVEASRKLIYELNIKPVLKLKKFPGKGAVLIYSNHVTGLDPFLISSLLGREDFMFLGDKYHTLKSKNISKFVAPTLTVNVFKELLQRSPLNWPGFLYMRFLVPPVSKIEAKKYNSKALNAIYKNVKTGHVSLVFPSGGQYEFLEWHGGIVKIIDMLNAKKAKFTLYRIKISKMNELKLLIHFLFFRKIPVKPVIYGYPVDLRVLRSGKLVNTLKTA